MKIQLVLLAICVAQSFGIEYKLEIRTGWKQNAETDGNIFAKLVGKNGKVVNFGILDDPHKNDFQRGNTDTFTAHSMENIGKIKCIVLSTNSPDKWMMDKAVASSSTSQDKVYFYNQGMFLSSTPSEGVSELKLCEQGTQTYYITTTTSTDLHSGSDNIYPRLRIIGRKGKKSRSATTGYLFDPARNNFEKGRQDTFVFQGLADVGKIKCIEVMVDGDDKWMFEMIEVHSQDLRHPKYFRNENEAWLSTDQREGESSLKLCS